MKNAVNSMEHLIKVNIEPSLVGNYLEGVTTRVEPKAEAMAIITHSIESNPIEKRSAPDKKGDDIVCSAWRYAEEGGNDLLTFGEFNFNMARTAIGNQVIKMISRFPITIKKNIGAFVMNIKTLTELGFSQSATLASVVISLASFRRLLAPVLSLVSFYIPFISPVIGASPYRSRTPNLTVLRAIFTGELSATVRKGFTTIRTNLRNRAFVARIILTGVDLTAKLQKTISTTSLFNQRPFTEKLTADNTRFELLISFPVALSRTVFAVLSGKFFTANWTTSHTNIILQLDSIVK